MAKTRRGKPTASRAKGTKKSAAKRTKKPARKAMAKSPKQEPYGLDLKKLKADIGKANDVLAKRLAGADPEKAQKLKDTQSKLMMWASDIDSICSDPGGEPCGPTMLIS